MIDQIEIYGPAWADIAGVHCKPGGRLEGRDQAKLKDKARNLKEKFIRYHPENLYTPLSFVPTDSDIFDLVFSSFHEYNLIITCSICSGSFCPLSSLRE